MSKKTPAWAAKVAAQINQNVADVGANRITWEEFGERQRAAWDSVTKGEPNIMGSACDRRMMAVHAALARPVPPCRQALDLAVRIGACKHYAQRLNDLEVPPNGDDFNALLALLDGGKFSDPSNLSR